MKKGKVLLYITLALFTLCLNNKVSADDGVIGFLECKYNVGASGKMDTKYVNNGVMSFYYSELEYMDKGLKGKLWLKNKNYPDSFSSVYDASIHPSGDGFSSELRMEELSQLTETFKPSYEENNQNCPKYLVLKKTGTTGWINVEDLHTPYFTNDSSFFCGSDGSNCPVIAQNIPGGERIMVYPGEREWTFNTSGEGSCDDANVRIFISGTKIKGEISYPGSSSFYEKSAKKAVIVDVQTNPSEEGKVQLRYIYNLFKNGTIEKGFIRGDAGHEKVAFNDGGLASGSCDLSSNRSVSTVFNCTQFKSIESTLNNYQNKFENLEKEFNNLAQNNLKKSGDNWVSIDYSKFTNIDSLASIAEDLDNYTNKDKKGGEILTAYDNYRKFLEEKYEELCSEDKYRLENLMTDLGKRNEAITAKASGMKDALEKIRARLAELNAEEEAKKLDEYLENNAEFLEEMKRLYSVTNASSLLGGKINLEFREGCGVITSDLKDWLIQLLDIIKIVALILTLVLGMFDFFKGVASGEADAMKKVWKSFSRRLIAVVLLFLLPVIIEFILGLVSINGVNADNPLCGIK